MRAADRAGSSSAAVIFSFVQWAQTCLMAHVGDAFHGQVVLFAVVKPTWAHPNIFNAVWPFDSLWCR